ncbi:MAG: hypothetical protein PUH38_02660 [Acidaminococcus fermentans]|uniref:hypothetical protein n=1 Tax=Acidaminococcus fermentans TaxID=905 RepID=UPI0024310480|nr:hypothetical protein [Acidaminococcus fermentans]MDD7195364.1 hypothetical protein [Acidaminococcus fermentans]
MAFDIQFKLIYQGIRDVFRVRSLSYFYKKYVGLDIPQFWKQIGRISLSVGLCLVVGYGVDHVFPGTGKLAFLLKILGYTVLYGAVVYFMAMSPEEKEKVRGIGRKVK